jgi:hypothetical protein
MNLAWFNLPIAQNTCYLRIDLTAMDLPIVCFGLRALLAAPALVLCFAR